MSLPIWLAILLQQRSGGGTGIGLALLVLFVLAVGALWLNSRRRP